MTTTAPPAMRFTVDGWDPGYGTSLDLDEPAGESAASIEPDVEVPPDSWRPLTASPGRALPAAILFADGVRRIDARLWVDDQSAGGAATSRVSAALAASYAAGVVCCCGPQAHVICAQRRRGLFTVAPHATDITTPAGVYTAARTTAGPAMPLGLALQEAMQRRLGEIELSAALEAHGALAGHGVAPGTELLVIDGPLRHRRYPARTIGYIKSHRATYLPDRLNQVIDDLTPGQRTPVFGMVTNWERHAWYLRLPSASTAPWSGIVRVECPADLRPEDAVELADLSQLSLGRFASQEYKDSRAPQNLYPIAGLERELRRQLGDPRLLYRALRQAAG